MLAFCENELGGSQRGREPWVKDLGEVGLEPGVVRVGRLAVRLGRVGVGLKTFHFHFCFF